jgi:hypothetical protein
MMRTGVRLSGVYEDMTNAARLNGEEKNTRVDGFNLADKNMAELRKMELSSFDYAFSEHMSLRLVD